MYSSRGSNAYGQSYGGQSPYGQNLGSTYSGGSVGGHEVGQQSLASRHSSVLGARQDTDVGGYRGHVSSAPHYGGQYSYVYGSTGLSSGQEVPPLSAKGSVASTLESRGGYVSGVRDSPKFASGEYVPSSSHGYGNKIDHLYAEKVSDYPALERRQYTERQSEYVGRDLHGEATGHLTDSVGYGHQHQTDIYDRVDQSSLLRQEQLLRAQSLQSASLDGSARQTDYLAARGAASRHSTQDLISFGGRVDADPRSSSMLSSSSYSGQHAPSILGAAPRRNAEDVMYRQGASNPGYGVSLPPGRDYATGKALHGNSLDMDFPGNLLSHGGHKERKDERAGYLREFELREEERRRERLRERERDREREKERERARDRERERERARIMERERERKRARALEIRHERTPARASRDLRSSSLSKEVRSSRRETPHHEASHRLHSPVKEKRREYVCKVYSSSLIEVERDYLSIDRRYPKLFVSPELSKVVVNWPKGDLKLSILTPVSFEHDFIEEKSVRVRESLSKSLDVQSADSEQRTVWNAKLILMSGLSRNSLEELSSDKVSDDRMPHICNILRFAIMKKDHSFMAIGGPWESNDGGDPSADSSLIKTVQRYAKDIIQLDLCACEHWNRFLEIHYNRIGKDGLFSHKEVTVLFLPNLSQCLPSLDAWREQWLAHKKAVAAGDRDVTFKREKSRDNKEASKEKIEQKKEVLSSKLLEDAAKKEKGGDNIKSAIDEKNDENNKKKSDSSASADGSNVAKDEQGGAGIGQSASTVKPVKKKVIRKVVKQKVVNKTAGEIAGKEVNKIEEKDGVDKNETSSIPPNVDESSADLSTVKTFVRKKIIKNVLTAKAAENEGNLQTDAKDVKEMDSSEEKLKQKLDQGSDAGVKTTIKRKIIKRVPKKKVSGETSNVVGAEAKTDNGNNAIKAGDAALGTVRETTEASMAVDEGKAVKKVVPIKNPKTKQDNVIAPNVIESSFGKQEPNNTKGTHENSSVGTDSDKEKVSQKDGTDVKKGKPNGVEKSKDEKGKSNKDLNDESKLKLNKEVKEKCKFEEPPRHPGLILQTKQNKDSKLRSLSLSLDSLLSYSDNDLEDSTFELSVFAETLYEMLQYQMGCRILDFLQKLRIKFVTKRAERKRQRGDKSEMESLKKSESKRLRTNELPVKKQSGDEETSNEAQKEEKEIPLTDDTPMTEEDANMEHDTEDEEDPEEDPEEYEEVEEESSQEDISHEIKEQEQKTVGNDGSGKFTSDKKLADGSSGEDNAEAEEKEKPSEGLKEKLDKSKEDTTLKETSVDKELLQAFRFFDRNQVGYIRVEDMRLMIHNLGKFLTHRDVKELVQSALLESNTGRDDHILYNKLVRMTGI